MADTEKTDQNDAQEIGKLTRKLVKGRDLKPGVSPITGCSPPEHARWKPGQSGNPGGRPKKMMTVQALAQEQAEKAIKALTQIMVNKKALDTARVQAATALLDRGFGKPSQSIDAKHTISLSEAFEGVLRDVIKDREVERHARLIDAAATELDEVHE